MPLRSPCISSLRGLPPPHVVHEQHRLHGVPVVRVVRRELVVPLQLARLRAQRDDARCVEVVTEALFAREVRTRIADRPVDEIELRIVRAGHPGGAAAVLERLADPGLRSFLAALRNRVPAPHALAGRRAIGIEKAARAFFAAGDARPRADRRRASGGEVELYDSTMRSHFRVPQLLAREPVECQEMRVVGHHERPVAADRDAAIGADAAFAEDALRARASL